MCMSLCCTLILFRLHYAVKGHVHWTNSIIIITKQSRKHAECGQFHVSAYFTLPGFH